MKRDPDRSSSLVVVGAGAAGLMAAVCAAKAGASRVAVFEQLPEAGVRFLATGGGRCNFTNTLETDDFLRRFGAQSRFVAPALRAMNGERLRLFFEEIGIPSRSPDGFHVFPVAGSAQAVRNALLQSCRKLKVEIVYNCKVRGLQTGGGHVTGIMTSGGMEFASRAVLAAGGKSYPELGGGESGFSLARQAGHTIVPPCPALVPLVTRETWPATLAGLSLARVVVKAEIKNGPRAAASGGLLFTHRGISGPAVLDISGIISAWLQTKSLAAVTIDLSPGRTAEDWQATLEAERKKHGAKTALSALGAFFPAALAEVVLDLADVPAGAKVAQLSRAQMLRLVAKLKNLPLSLSGTEGFEKAMVTKGGVNLGEVNPKTLESRIVRGLFFAGEILDVDGPCGGFNLQWAFSSGRLAGVSAVKQARPGLIDDRPLG